jgi:tetratricopeptide (TPR) repeat protein
MAPRKHATNAFEIDRLATQLAKDPQSKAFLPLAEEYCKVGMWEEAVGVLEDGLKYYPAFITAMVVLGRAYDQLNQPTKARAVLEGAVKLSPENLRAHRTLIKIYAAQGLRQEAMTSCRAILAMNPKDEEALAVQASLAMKGPDKANPCSDETQGPANDSPCSTADTSDARPVDNAGVSSLAAHSRPTDGARSQGDPPTSEGTAVQVNMPVPTNCVRRGDTLAQLESWLRSLRQRRRDSSADSTVQRKP